MDQKLFTSSCLFLHRVQALAYGWSTWAYVSQVMEESLYIAIVLQHEIGIRYWRVEYQQPIQQMNKHTSKITTKSIEQSGLPDGTGIDMETIDEQE